MFIQTVKEKVDIKFDVKAHQRVWREEREEENDVVIF